MKVLCCMVYVLQLTLLRVWVRGSWMLWKYGREEGVLGDVGCWSGLMQACKPQTHFNQEYKLVNETFLGHHSIKHTIHRFISVEKKSFAFASEFSRSSSFPKSDYDRKLIFILHYDSNCRVIVKAQHWDSANLKYCSLLLRTRERERAIGCI